MTGAGSHVREADRRQSWLERWAPEVMLGCAAVLLSAANGWWVWTVRARMPYSIDEAGYLQRAIRDGQALVHGGVVGLVAAVRSPDIQAPLVPVIGALAYPFAHGSLLKLMMSLQLLYLGLVVATYLLARQTMGRWWAVLAALLVACSAGIVDQSRTFLFAVAATATFTAALGAHLAAHNGRRRGWLLGAGVLSGLTLLARTMMIAFVAVLWMVGLVAVLAEAGDRRRRLLRYLVTPATGVAVAATWYSAQWSYVWQYLTEYGYGRASAHYGRSSHILLIGILPERLGNILSKDFYVPTTAVLLVGLVTLVSSTWLEARGARPDVVQMVAGRRAQMTLVAVGCLAALCSTGDQGSAFELPMIPVIVVLGVAGLACLQGRWVRRVLVSMACLFGGAVVALKTVPTVPPTTMDVSVLGVPAVVASSSSTISRYVHRFGEPGAGNRAMSATWLTDSRRAEEFMYTFAGRRGYLPVVFFATEGPLFNTNTVQLEAQVQRGQLLPMGVFRNPRRVHMGFVQQLDAHQYGIPNWLVAVSGRGAAEFTVTPDTRATMTAEGAGFREVWRQRLANGTWVTLYWRRVGPRVAGRGAVAGS